MIFDQFPIPEPTYLGLLTVAIVCNIIYFSIKIIEYIIKKKKRKIENGNIQKQI